MSSKSSRASSAFGPIGSFSSGFAESIGRAQKAQEVMRRPESYFVRRGTTQEQAIRRIFDV